MNSHFLQSEAWSVFHEAMGHTTHRRSGDGWEFLAVEEDGGGGLKRLYTPYGPTVDSEAALEDALTALVALAKQVKAAYVRVQPSGPGLTPGAIAALGLKPIKHSQPEHTWRLDLTQDAEAILNGMAGKKRNLYRNYTKKGMSYRVSTDPADVEDLIRLMHGVEDANDVNFHEDEYFRTQARALMPRGFARLHFIDLAKEDGTTEPIGAALSYDGDEVTYYAYAAASHEFRKLPASTVLLAEMIMRAKDDGQKTFDFYGITDSEDPDHPWAGFTKFKKTYGGYQHDFSATYELGVNKPAYWLYSLARKIQQRGK
ncbi:lipid II:glycine glycyltransferase FemX [Haematomicrobium sanguinis]|uniref:lipid II:glycine glycyltransferase FemX n=1 Tax=Haematomicrobium sanguinis TaxID=479106 RepID=UPI0004792475|nr:peptidoglycan bridge formation glycyltransferase FemA/FemB family protein [Haematomicrobium sanguinis]